MIGQQPAAAWRLQRIAEGEAGVRQCQFNIRGRQPLRLQPLLPARAADIEAFQRPNRQPLAYDQFEATVNERSGQRFARLLRAAAGVRYAAVSRHIRRQRRQFCRHLQLLQAQERRHEIFQSTNGVSACRHLA